MFKIKISFLVMIATLAVSSVSAQTVRLITGDADVTGTLVMGGNVIPRTPGSGQLGVAGSPFGSIGTTNITVNDSSSLDGGVTIGVGCPNPTPPGCDEGLIITQTTGGGARTTLMRFTSVGELTIPGNMNLGGAFTMSNPLSSIGSASSPIPSFFATSMNTAQLELGGGTYRTLMHSNPTDNNVTLALPTGNPVAGAMLFVSSTTNSQQSQDVEAELVWQRVTDASLSVSVPDITAGTTVMVELPTANIPTQGTSIVCPATTLPQGLIVAYSIVSKGGVVSVALHNATGFDIPGFTETFLVTVMPYVP